MKDDDHKKLNLQQDTSNKANQPTILKPTAIQAKPIVIIDDDEEDLELISQAFEELRVPNELVCFSEPGDALEFVKNSEAPMFILCDINMRGIDGFALRKMLFDDPDLRRKSIPFLFLSTSDGRAGVAHAYDLSVQGYFVKPNSYEELVDLLRTILKYWNISEHPNKKKSKEK